MKTLKFIQSQKGFTLVELLVVIAIIAALAASGFAIGPAMMNKARKVSALAGATALNSAVEQFYSEYSALPDGASSSSDVDATVNTTSAQGAELLNILSGLGNNSQNSRKIRFLNAKEAKNNRDGIVYNSGGTTAIQAMYDPWGQPYLLHFDYDYDETLTFTPTGSDQVKLNQRRLAVYSLGVDNPARATAKDLVKTW